MVQHMRDGSTPDSGTRLTLSIAEVTLLLKTLDFALKYMTLSLQERPVLSEGIDTLRRKLELAKAGENK